MPALVRALMLALALVLVNGNAGGARVGDYVCRSLASVPRSAALSSWIGGCRQHHWRGDLVLQCRPAPPQMSDLSQATPPHSHSMPWA